jgi:hypothetical protein
MAKTEYVLNIGDDNVVLTRLNNGKVANAWLGSPDPAMAQEELGEALAEDSKGRISVLVDTLDQSFKDEEIPRVGILDRRKLLARHINMAFPGANLRGARLVAETSKKTIIYEMASVPLDGRIPGWLDFIQSLPHEKGGIFSVATENVDLLTALGPKDAPVEEGKNHWRHLIGVNVTGGLRQIIEKNGRLSLTRLTQAPPADTPPADFADMIIRDFKATITYIRRLGYQVGEPLDLVVLTTPENKAVLQDHDWDGARSVSVYTPYEAGALLGLGSLGREDQAYSDVLHAAWFASKKKPVLPLSRAAALGDTKDDIRELAFLAAPYAAGLLMAALIGWSAWTGYELIDHNGKNAELQAQYDKLAADLAVAQAGSDGLPHPAERIRNVLSVVEKLEAGKVDVTPLLGMLSSSLESDAIVLSLDYAAGEIAAARPAASGAKPAAGSKPPAYILDLSLRLAPVVASADEAVQTARNIEDRLTSTFGNEFRVELTVSPVGAQAETALAGGLSDSEADLADTSRAESFYASYRIEKVQK